MKTFIEYQALQEVLSKSEPASKWIDDFINSDDPKFAGKSKEKRKQMALAAYYAKQRDEEVELDEDLKNIGDLVKASHDKIKASIASNSRKSRAQRNADNKDKILAKYKNIGKFIVQDEEVDLDEADKKDDPCWKGYQQIGMKKKGGKEVPNCVPESVEEQFDLIEEVVEGLSAEHGIDSEVIWENFEEFSDEELLEYAIDAKGHKSSTGGLTQKGVDAYNAKTGGNLKTAVTTPPSKLKPGSKAANRRKSFCARMSGVEGPMKDDKGRPTRKALALRKWNC